LWSRISSVFQPSGKSLDADGDALRQPIERRDLVVLILVVPSHESRRRMYCDHAPRDDEEAAQVWQLSHAEALRIC